MNDLSDELIEFLEYVEHSNDATAVKAKGSLVKKIHERVIEVKSDASVEVEFMTLLERDREKMEEAKLEDAKNFLKLGVSKEIVIEATALDKEKVEKLLEEIIKKTKLS